jgi:hypothetical protein
MLHFHSTCLCASVWPPTHPPHTHHLRYLTPDLLARVPALANPTHRVWFDRHAQALHEDAALASSFVNAAFSTAGVVVVHTSKNPLMRLGNVTLGAVCRPEDPGMPPPNALQVGVDLGPQGGAPPMPGQPEASLAGADVTTTSVGRRYCVSARAWAAVFAGPAPMPTGPVFDFLFRPNLEFVARSLVPLLRQLPAWNRAGPRVGVHLRTFALDQERCGRARVWRVLLGAPAGWCWCRSSSMSPPM